MDTVLLKIETAETLRASDPDAGVTVGVHNLGAAGEREIAVEIGELGIRSVRKIDMERNEETSVRIPLDLGSVKEPRTAMLEASCPGKMPAKATRLLTFLPREYYDAMSPTLTADLVDSLVSRDFGTVRKSLGADSMEAYYALKDMNLLDDDPGRYVHVTEPYATRTYGDGTPLEVSLVYMSDLVSRGYTCCMLRKGGHILVGATDGKPAGGTDGLADRFIVVEPSASCRGVPLAVSKDLSKGIINRFSETISEGRDLAFCSPGDAE